MTRARLLLPLVLVAAGAVHPLDHVDLRISDSARAVLEADPYWAPKVPATWIAGAETVAVGASYRGAYSLKNLLEDGRGLRNWKIKTAKGASWRGYREWNFNLEDHLRQKLALDLYRRAGVPAAAARHVVLYVNGRRQGLYLEFADPDNKSWLLETFGTDSGDLYKAATDIPGTPARFGELTDQGDGDSAYWGRYQKKTHDSGPDSLDYSALREFVTWVNRASDAEFAAGLERRLDLPAFLRYLVVTNFASQWDGYPNRGKNYWLHHDRRDGRWTLVPWDVDATFQSNAWCLDNMGTAAGLFFMEWPRGYCPNTLETRSRPLLERVFRVEAWKRLFVGEYQQALRSWLREDSLIARLDTLEAAILPELSGTERIEFLSARSDMRSYIAARSRTVAALLAAQPASDPLPLSVGRPQPSAPTVPSGEWRDPRGRIRRSLEGAPPGVWRNGREVRILLR